MLLSSAAAVCPAWEKQQVVVGAADGPGKQAIGRERSEQDCASVWKKQSRGSVLSFDSSGVLSSHLGFLQF